MKMAAAMQPCLAAVVCRDVGVNVGFGRYAHLYIPQVVWRGAKWPPSFSPRVLAVGVGSPNLGAFWVALMALVTAKSVVVSSSAIGSVPLFLWRFVPPSTAWPLCPGEGVAPWSWVCWKCRVSRRGSRSPPWCVYLRRRLCPSCASWLVSCFVGINVLCGSLLCLPWSSEQS